MNRKTIAVCYSGFSMECESLIVDGVKKACREHNVNLLIFNSLLRKSDYPKENLEKFENVLRGESELFNLLNYRLLDGVIILGNTIRNVRVINEIKFNCDKFKIPYVNVDDAFHLLAHNVIVQNENAMEKMVRHLVEVHKLTRINFVAGVKNNKVSDDRLEAYKNVLRENDIPVDENRIGYGNFWTGAVNVVEKFLEYDVPEAIVCANDSMAIITMDYLKNRGFSIPKDIIVTGFDGISDAEKYEPSVTTIKIDYRETGKKSFEMLTDLMNKVKREQTLVINAELELRESCGCMQRIKPKYDFIKEMHENNHRFAYFSADLMKMNNYSVNAETQEEMFQALKYGLSVFSLKRAFICLNFIITSDSPFFYGDKPENELYGLTEKVVSMLQIGHKVPVGKVFANSKLLPVDFLNEPEPACVTFSPFYFQNKYLGYFAYEISYNIPPELINMWIQTASSTMGSYYIKSELENMYLKDSLTDVYNRRGMNKLFSKYFSREYVESEKGFLTVICSDIDYLKKVNDAWGHEAGDLVIRCCADAFKYCLPKESICVRTGGDEFCILIPSKRKLDMDFYIGSIKLYLDKFNESSGKPFKAGCSCGYVTESVNADVSLEKMLRAADGELYKIKANRKS